MMHSKFHLLILTALASVVGSLFLAGCTKKPSDMDFKLIQLRWNALSPAAESASIKDSCEILITSKLMTNRRILSSEIPELQYDVSYDVDSSGALAYKGVCSGGVGVDLIECSWELTCGSNPDFVVKFHNEQ